MIDRRLVPDEQEVITPGEAVAGMILNGLGFAHRPLSLTPQFFANKPLDLLLREGITAEMFNRFKLGRTLDEAYAYGCNLLFEELALAVCTHEGIDLRFNHLDTTVATRPPAPWPELAGETLGILGYGRIGQCVAWRAQAFDMAVWAMRRDPTRSDPHGLAFLGGPDALDTILQSADYLAITLSLSAATRGLLGQRELALMKPTAVLINVARAEIVEEAALYHALAQKTIAGAVLDVWYHYPTAPGPTWPARHAFQELPHVLMTPHVSGWTEGMLEARAQGIAANIHRVARGEPPLHLIPASAGHCQLIENRD